MMTCPMRKKQATRDSNISDFGLPSVVISSASNVESSPQYPSYLIASIVRCICLPDL